MAKNKDKTLLQRGIALDPANSNIKLKDVIITKDELYNELAQDWANVEAAKDQVNAKRQVRVLEKAFTAPCFPDQMIPLKPNCPNEARYFLMLIKARDTLMFLTSLLYEESLSKETAADDKVA